MKKLFSVLILFTVLGSFTLASCKGKEGADNSSAVIEKLKNTKPAPETDFNFELRKDGTVRITKYLGNAKYLVIPDTIQGVAVTGVAFNDCYLPELIGILIPEGVEYIESLNAENLQTIILPSSLKVIGSLSFYKCSKLTNIELPSSLKVIDSLSFYNCSMLTNIELPEGLQYIGSGAFYNSGITSITFNSNPIIICLQFPSNDKGAFSECNDLAEINIPEDHSIILAAYFNGRIEKSNPISFNTIFSGEKITQSIQLQKLLQQKSIDGKKYVSFINETCKYADYYDE